MDSAGPYLKLVGRVLLSIMFIQSGVGKVFGYAGTEEHMNAAGVPGTLLPLVIVTEVGGGLLVLLGLFTRYAAIALAGFCVLAAWFFHYQPGDMGQMINFMKNITIAGGLLQAIPAVATVITIALAQGEKNMAFSRDAISLAVRAPATPPECATDSVIVTDPVSGLSFEFSMWCQYKQVHYELAATWGVKTFNPNHLKLLTQ